MATPVKTLGRIAFTPFGVGRARGCAANLRMKLQRSREKIAKVSADSKRAVIDMSLLSKEVNRCSVVER